MTWVDFYNSNYDKPNIMTPLQGEMITNSVGFLYLDDIAVYGEDTIIDRGEYYFISAGGYD